MDALQSLAQLYGIQTSYYDISGQEHLASSEGLLRILQTMGASLSRMEDAPAALRERRQQLWRRCLEPVTLAWDGHPSEALLRLPASLGSVALNGRIDLESGEQNSFAIDLAGLAIADRQDVEGVAYSAYRLRLPHTLPIGYHRLTVELPGQTCASQVIAAPTRAYEPQEAPRRKSWGVFLPLYALHSEKSWGAGDFADLERLTEWVTSQGGSMVATLPLLAAFLDEPFEPGPYSPASRLFWNEFFLTLERIPELEQCPAARKLMESAEYQKDIGDLRAQPLVDYRRQMKLKRRVLSELMQCFFAQATGRRELFQRFLATHPQTEDYARFRAVGERLAAPWPAWSDELKNGTIREGDYEESARRYHLYVQWQANEQLQGLADKARSTNAAFYLDLPLGVHPDSYDVWRERALFAVGTAAGAPPDPFFAKGQNWGFPPLHPEQIRTQGYRYIRSYVQHHMKLARMLRIDHMMGFHRLYWVPQGMDASAGVYVQYPAQELYAVFSLESHRHQSVLVGEDLGTVPPEVRPAMEQHNVRRMYVMQYELQPQYHNALKPAYPGSVAGLNTHDMSPFAGYWRGLDIEDRVALGVLDRALADQELRNRWGQYGALARSLRHEGRLQGTDDHFSVLRACLGYMASGQAAVTLINLEDLWLEELPQNIPGTWRERPNWRRKARHTLETFMRLPQVLDVLRQVNETIRAT